MTCPSHTAIVCPYACPSWKGSSNAENAFDSSRSLSEPRCAFKTTIVLSFVGCRALATFLVREPDEGGHTTPRRPLASINEILSTLPAALVEDSAPGNDNGRVQLDTKVRMLVGRRCNDDAVRFDETVALLCVLLAHVAGMTSGVSGVYVDDREVDVDEMLALDITSTDMETLVDVLEARTPRLGQRAARLERMSCIALHLAEGQRIRSASRRSGRSMMRSRNTGPLGPKDDRLPEPGRGAHRGRRWRS